MCSHIVEEHITISRKKKLMWTLVMIFAYFLRLTFKLIPFLCDFASYCL